MSKSITNKTRTALRVPLPRGKVLRLGPNQTGHISPHDFEHPPLKKLVQAGTIEVVDDKDNESIPAAGRRRRKPFER